MLIAVGGLVRATDSGLGCPDWPRCFGRLVPPAELHAWIEHSHRLVASVVMVLVAWLVVAAWRTGQDKVVRRAAVAALVMVLAQALIGAFVVWWKLRADSVTLHLATALALVGLLIWIAFRARRRRPPTDRERLYDVLDGLSLDVDTVENLRSVAGRLDPSLVTARRLADLGMLQPLTGSTEEA